MGLGQMKADHEKKEAEHGALRAEVLGHLQELSAWEMQPDHWMERSSYVGVDTKKGERPYGHNNKLRGAWLTILSGTLVDAHPFLSDEKRTEYDQRMNDIREAHREHLRAGSEAFTRDVISRLQSSEVCSTYGACEREKLSAIAAAMAKDSSGMMAAGLAEDLLPHVAQAFPVNHKEKKEIKGTGKFLVTDRRTGLEDFFAKIIQDIDIDGLKREHLGTSVDIIEQADALLTDVIATLSSYTPDTTTYEESV